MSDENIIERVAAAVSEARNSHHAWRNEDIARAAIRALAESEADAGPEHQCGGPREACCIPGCDECGAPSNTENDRLVAHRVTNWSALLAANAALRVRIAELDRKLTVLRAKYTASCLSEKHWREQADHRERDKGP